MSVATRRLPRVLGLFDVSVLASAAMGPAYSLASTMGLLVVAANGAAPLALAALVAIMLCVAIAFSRLAREYPNAGSSFAWAAAAFGPSVGAYAAWMLLLSNYFATVAIALPAATYTLELFSPGLVAQPGWNAFVAILWISASTALLYVGMRPTAFATALFLVAEFVVVAASAVAALFAHPAPDLRAYNCLHCDLHGPGIGAPALSFGGFATAMVLGIWMTDGWEVSSSASEETTGDASTPGRGGIVGLLATAAILIFAIVAYQRIGEYAGFKSHADDAMAYVADRLGAPWWRPTLLVTVLVSTAATLWTTVLYLSRSLFAMGRSHVLPEALGRLDARAVPAVTLVTIYVATVAFVIATAIWPSAGAALDTILNATAVFLGVLFCLSAFAAMRLVASASGPKRFLSLAVPAAGAILLAAVIGIDVEQSDATTRSLEIAGLLLGIPFALWRRRSAGAGAATLPVSAG